MLTPLDSEHLAHSLNRWLAHHDGTLPGALALDTKFFREAVGVLSRVETDTSAPVTSAIVD